MASGSVNVPGVSYPEFKAALAKKAPAGYGYGGFVVDLDYLADESAFETALTNLLSEMVWGEAKQIQFVVTSLSDYRFVGTLFKSSTAGYGFLVAYSGLGGYTTGIFKNCVAGTWEPVEFMNPPMALGIEYRTTKRFRGKPVYAKMFDFGALPNATYKSISHGLTPTAIVDLSASSTNGKYYFPSTSNSESVDLYINASYIMITTKGDWSSVSAYVTVEYTKE